MLGSTVAANLFPAGDAVGAAVVVKSVPFTVLGVLASKGQAYVNAIMISASAPDTEGGVIDSTLRIGADCVVLPGLSLGRVLELYPYRTFGRLQPSRPQIIVYSGSLKIQGGKSWNLT